MQIKIDFDSWEKETTRFQSGLIVAPKTLSVSSFKKETQLVSFGQACKIERRHLIPHGWRLPTIAELEEIAKHIVRRSYHDMISQTIALHLDDNRRYNDWYRINPDRLFWSNEEKQSPHIAYALSIIDPLFRDYGNRIRNPHLPPKDKQIKAKIICVKIQ